MNKELYYEYVSNLLFVVDNDSDLLNKMEIRKNIEEKLDYSFFCKLFKF
jgi:hypothetical protein